MKTQRPASPLRSEVWQVDGLSVVVNRRRIKHCWVRVLPVDGQVQVSAPLGISRSQILAIVRQRQEWIAAAQQRLRTHPCAPVQLVDGGAWRLWGHDVQVRLRSDPALSPAQVQRLGPLLEVRHAPHHDDAALADAVRRWEDGQLLEVVGRLLEHWQPIVGRQVSALTLRAMRTRWGSCTPSTARVRLNRELIRHRQALLEYVLVHELTHLHVPGHGQDFRARMDTYLPDWRTRRRALSEPQR